MLPKQENKMLINGENPFDEENQTDNHQINKDSILSCVSSIGPFNPQSLWYKLWNVLVIFIVLYNSVMVPLIIGFNVVEINIAIYIFDYLGDIIYIVDILIRLRTMIMSKGVMTYDTRKMFKNYLSSWFIIDFISSFPIDAFVWSSVLEHYAFRITRIFRLAHAYSYFYHFEMRARGAHYFLMQKLILALLLINHWLACIYFFIANTQGFSSSPMMPGSKIEIEPLYYQYLFGYWWAAHVITRFGGTVIDPVTPIELVLMLFVSFLCTFWMAIVIGGMAELISTLQHNKTEFRKKVTKLKNFMHSKNLPKKLRTKIEAYYEHLWWKHHGRSDEEIMNSLPKHIQAEVKHYLNADLVSKVPFFQNCSKGFVKLITSHLSPVIFSPGDRIVRQGEAGNEMFFIYRGSVEIYTKDRKDTELSENSLFGEIPKIKNIITTLSEGDSFGEIVLLVDSQRTASAKAKTYCDLFVLNKQQLSEVLSFFPQYRAKLLEMAEQRISYDLFRNLIKKEKFFDFSPQLRTSLIDYMAYKKYAKGEIIRQTGTRLNSDHFIFIGKGKVSVIQKGKPLDLLLTGSFYGEQDLRLSLDSILIEKGDKSIYSTVTLQVTSNFALVLSLSSENFCKVLEKFPVEKEEYIKREKIISLMNIHNTPTSASHHTVVKRAISRFLVDNQKSPSKTPKEKTKNKYTNK